MSEDAIRKAVDATPMCFGDRDIIYDALAAERKAWARLVRAERALDVAGRPWETDAERAQHEKRCEEAHAARQALRDLGVPVDALLEGP